MDTPAKMKDPATSLGPGLQDYFVPATTGDQTASLGRAVTIDLTDQVSDVGESDVENTDVEEMEVEESEVSEAEVTEFIPANDSPDLRRYCLVMMNWLRNLRTAYGRKTYSKLAAQTGLDVKVIGDLCEEITTGTTLPELLQEVRPPQKIQTGKNARPDDQSRRQIKLDGRVRQQKLKNIRDGKTARGCRGGGGRYNLSSNHGLDGTGARAIAAATTTTQQGSLMDTAANPRPANPLAFSFLLNDGMHNMEMRKNDSDGSQIMSTTLPAIARYEQIDPDLARLFGQTYPYPGDYPQAYSLAKIRTDLEMDDYEANLP